MRSVLYKGFRLVAAAAGVVFSPVAARAQPSLTSTIRDSPHAIHVMLVDSLRRSDAEAEVVRAQSGSKPTIVRLVGGRASERVLALALRSISIAHEQAQRSERGDVSVFVMQSMGSPQILPSDRDMMAALLRDLRSAPMGTILNASSRIAR